MDGEEAGVGSVEHRVDQVHAWLFAEDVLPLLHVPAARAVTEGSRDGLPLPDGVADEGAETRVVALLDRVARLLGLLAGRPSLDEDASHIA